MDYNNIYNKLIYQYREHPKISGKTERHHIKPKSLGGTNKSENLVNLPARVHYIAHLLLWKIFGGSMTTAFWCMTTTGGNKVNSRLYEKLRNQHSHDMKRKMSGRTVSEETKNKLRKPKSEAHKAAMRKPKSEAGKANMRLSMQGIKKKISPKVKAYLSEVRRKNSLGERNVSKREEVRQKIRSSKIGERNPMKSPIVKEKVSNSLLEKGNKFMYHPERKLIELVPKNKQTEKVVSGWIYGRGRRVEGKFIV